ncbi:MAG: hypothetical protein FD143_805 [Ignavibacteria bacterium]|nr:MAG: hypothetical protein FD143_805 [Ignavibacteria bacterium]KAF0160609.1 MAG: hypothetical protein FD188_1601 [Ignavibacteria bacterium]
MEIITEIWFGANLGQQQLLLIVLGILVVGMAVFVGISLFRASAIESKRAIITNELVNLAAMAQQYYLKPSSLGGGNRKFTGWVIPPELLNTAAGHYTVNIFQDSAIISGIGNEVVTNNDSLKMQINVRHGSYKTIIIN